jgi:hypothetical protein
MDDLDLAQPAFVFWMNDTGGVTRFERLDDAIQSIMQTGCAKTAPIAWIQTRDRHLSMDEIRSIAKRSSLTWRLSQIMDHVGEMTATVKSIDRPNRRRRRWSIAPTIPQV